MSGSFPEYAVGGDGSSGRFDVLLRRVPSDGRGRVLGWLIVYSGAAEAPSSRWAVYMAERYTPHGVGYLGVLPYNEGLLLILRTALGDETGRAAYAWWQLNAGGFFDAT